MELLYNAEDIFHGIGQVFGHIACIFQGFFRILYKGIAKRSFGAFTDYLQPYMADLGHTQIKSKEHAREYADTIGQCKNHV